MAQHGVSLAHASLQHCFSTIMMVGFTLELLFLKVNGQDLAVTCFVCIFTGWHLDVLLLDAEIIVLSRRSAPALDQTIIQPAQCFYYCRIQCLVFTAKHSSCSLVANFRCASSLLSCHTHLYLMKITNISQCREVSSGLCWFSRTELFTFFLKKEHTDTCFDVEE